MRGFRPSLTVVLLLLALPLAADSIQPSLTFTSTHQSIWGPGAAAPPLEKRFMMIDPNVVKWDVKTPAYPNYDGGFWEQDTYLFGVAEFGAGARARTHGRAGLWLDLKVDDPGSVDVTYPVTPTVVFPDANSFRAGDTVAVKTSYNLDAGWQMTTVSPQFEASLEGTFGMHGEAKAKLCVFDCAEPQVVPSFDVELGEFTVFKVKPGDVLETPAWLGEFTPWSGSIGVPNIATTATLQGDAQTLASHGTDEFISIALDLTAVATDVANAAGIPVPPLSFSTDNYPGVGNYGIHFHYEIITVQAVARLNARQNFRFDPDLKAVFVFGQPLEHWIVNGGVVGATQTAATATVPVGATLYVKYPSTDKQPTSIGTTFRLDNEFQSATGLDLAETIETSAGQLGLTIPSIEVFPELCTPEVEFLGETIIPEICTPSVETPQANVDIGPLFEHTLPVASQNLGDVFSGSWQLQGFAALPVSAFSLDPENPIVNIDQQTGAVRNLGGGRRQVTYAIDYANGGDVKLSNVHLVSDLSNAFGAAHSFNVDQIIGCDFAANPSFNGASDKEMLAPNTELEVGEGGRVILVVSVYPKPDPPAYVSTSTVDGTSQLGTLVTKSDSSDVTLGPGVITDYGDHVLFGDHFVKLDAIADTFGHIGSNDFVEVKNGVSGIVAGDLRARRAMKVQGEITADYAYSGGVIDVVRSAKLNLSGNRKPYSNVPAFTLPAQNFTPNAAFSGNVWVGENAIETLQPGYYGDVTVNSGAMLKLVPGTYHFLSLHVRDNALVDLPGTSLNVRDQLVVGDYARLANLGGSSRNAEINVSDPGEINIGSGALVRGVLNASRANVTFNERSRLEGAAYARSITMRAGASAAFHVDCDQLVDPNCDGSADCGH